MGSYPRDTVDDAVAVPETRAERRDRATADTRASILAAARERLLAVGYANLSTRTVADAAGVPLSQIHYHFGSKQQLILDVLEAENERLLARQRTMYAGPEPLWRQWERACDYLDEDIESGYVRILQEMIAAGWSDAEVAAAVREYHRRLVPAADRGRASASRSGWAASGRSTPEEVAALMGLPFIGAESLILLGHARVDPARPVGPAQARRVHPVARGAMTWRRRRSRAVERARGREQTRARYPDETGYIERDGVRVFWERYGDGSPTILLMPTWSVVHSRHWKLQIPYLARHFRVVTFDGRGNGRSDRPTDAAAYADTEFVADAIAVLDATGTDRAVAAGLSMGAGFAVRLAVEHPERVLGPVPVRLDHPGRTIASRTTPTSAPTPTSTSRSPTTTAGTSTTPTTGAATGRASRTGSSARRCSPEPHSTKAVEDTVGWFLETDPGDDDHRGTRAVPRAAGGLGARPGWRATAGRSCAACAVRPWSSTAPTTTSCRSASGGRSRRRSAPRYVEIEGGGPLPDRTRARSSSNLLIRDFVRRLERRR